MLGGGFDVIGCQALAGYTLGLSWAYDLYLKTSLGGPEAFYGQREGRFGTLRLVDLYVEGLSVLRSTISHVEGLGVSRSVASYG